MPCYPLRYYNFCNVEGRQEHEKKALFLIRLEETSQLSDFLKCFKININIKYKGIMNRSAPHVKHLIP